MEQAVEDGPHRRRRYDPRVEGAPARVQVPQRRRPHQQRRRGGPGGEHGGSRRRRAPGCVTGAHRVRRQEAHRPYVRRPHRAGRTQSPAIPRHREHVAAAPARRRDRRAAAGRLDAVQALDAERPNASVGHPAGGSRRSDPVAPQTALRAVPPVLQA